MKEKRRYRNSGLIPIYFNNIFQKSTIIVFLISIGLMSISMVIAANPWLNQSDYLKYSNDFHLMYFEQGALLIQIFNSIIVSSLVISIVIQSNSFDTLFLSYISRSKICLIKFVNAAIILFILCLYEMTLFIGIGLLMYSNFIVEVTTLIGFLYLYIAMLFEMIIGILLTTILPIVLVPMCILFIFLVLKLICNNYDIIMEYITNVIPAISLNRDSLSFEMTNPLLSIIWVILCFVIYSNIYNIKDLK